MVKGWKKASGGGVIENLWKKYSTSYRTNMEIWAYKVRDKGKVKWAVTLRNVGFGMKDNLFKTKTEAMKLVRFYMKKY